jgi:acetyl-CoA acyltransferase
MTPAARAGTPVVLAWAHDTGADLAKTNVNGDAIASGNTLGASGTRIMTGHQTMCEGRRHGQRHD